MRGLLSGDPYRVARTLRRTVWTNDPEIFRTIALHKADVMAAIGDMVLPDRDAEDRRRKLFARFTGANGVGTVECACARGRAKGNPRTTGFTVMQDHVFAGHSDMTVQCDGCGRHYQVTEDAGYHIPQYQWSIGRF